MRLVPFCLAFSLNVNKTFFVLSLFFRNTCFIFVSTSYR